MRMLRAAGISSLLNILSILAVIYRGANRVWELARADA
jgi:hypothetical protein